MKRIQVREMTRREWRGFLIALGVHDTKTQDKLIRYLFRIRKVYP